MPRSRPRKSASAGNAAAVAAICRKLRADAAHLRRLGEQDRRQAEALIRLAARTDAAADALGCLPLHG